MENREDYVTFLEKLSAAITFDDAQRVLGEYSGPVDPEMAESLTKKNSNLNPDDQEKIRRSYRKAWILMNHLMNFVCEAKPLWEEVAVRIGEITIEKLPKLSGDEYNIGVLIALRELYSSRRKGDEVNNLQMATQFGRLACELYSPESKKLDRYEAWMIQGGYYRKLSALGVGSSIDEVLWASNPALLPHIKRGLLDPGYDQALDCFNRALSLSQTPQQQACSLIALAETHQKRGSTKDIQTAKEQFTKALEMLDSSQDKEIYIRGTNGLGNLYIDFGDELTDNPDTLAKEYFEEALRVGGDDPRYDPEVTYSNLATIYAEIPSEDQSTVLHAINLMQKAIQLYDERDETKIINSHRVIGEWYDLKLKDLESAAPWYEKAYQLLLTIDPSVNPNVLLKRSNQYHNVYRGMVRLYLHQGKLVEAFEVLMKSHSQFFRSFYSTKMNLENDSLLPKGLWEKVTETQGRQINAIRNLNDALEDQSSEFVHTLRKKAEAVTDEYHGLLEQVGHHSPILKRLLNAEPLSMTEVCLFLHPDQALLVFYPTNDETIVFVLREKSCDPVVNMVTIPSLSINELTKSVLLDWIVKYENYRNKSLPSPDDLDEIRSSMIFVIDDLSRKLNLSGLLPSLKGVSRLFLIPFYPFRFLPLHSLKLANGKQLLDSFDISYLPSINMIFNVETEPGNSEWPFLGVSNPRPYPPWNLSYSNCEVSNIASLFSQVSTFEGEQATRYAVIDNLENASVVHFSCHGIHGFVDITKSGLLLSKDSGIGVGEILNSTNAFYKQLITLSACETGLNDIRNFGDEFVDIPTSLFLKGTLSVISTLWQVEDRATTLLLYKFYKYLIEKKELPVTALKKAQTWLRDATGEELANLSFQMLDNVSPESEPLGFRLWAERQLLPTNREDKPYNNPIYWSAFYHLGK